MLVSIIMPSYNSERYIRKSIESIQKQTFTDWELLITDDCSTDQTCDVIASMAQTDSRIRLFTSAQNAGAGIARNHSISMARGRFIAFCDSDDQWLPEKLEKQLAFMMQQDCALSFSSYYTVTEDSEDRGVIVCKPTVSFRQMRRDNCIGCLTAVYDTDKIGKVYMPTIRKRQDWGLWLLILQKCHIAYGYQEPLAVYMIRSNDSVSSNKVSLITYNLKIYREILGYSLAKSYAFFILFFLPSYFTKKWKQWF